MIKLIKLNVPCLPAPVQSPNSPRQRFHRRLKKFLKEGKNKETKKNKNKTKEKIENEPISSSSFLKLKVNKS